MSATTRLELSRRVRLGPQFSRGGPERQEQVPTNNALDFPQALGRWTVCHLRSLAHPGNGAYTDADTIDDFDLEQDVIEIAA